MHFVQDIDFDLIDKNLDEHRYKSLCWIIQSILRSLLDLGLIRSFYHLRQVGQINFCVTPINEPIDIETILNVLIAMGSINGNRSEGNQVTVQWIDDSHKVFYALTSKHLLSCRYWDTSA